MNTAPPTPAVIFDIDGVLSDGSERIGLLRTMMAEGKGVDWEAFHANQKQDPIRAGWCALLRLLAPGVLIILVTNRAERYRAVTIEWLNDNGLYFDKLLMRDGVPGSRDSKGPHIDELIKDESISIQCAVDDDPGHEELYITRGIPFVYAHSGYYEGSEYVSMTADD